jgi:hypothetical protein
VREDLGHLLHREGAHGVGVDVALFENVYLFKDIDFVYVLAVLGNAS